MIPSWATCFVFLLLHFAMSYDYDDDDDTSKRCNQHETFNLADMDKIIKFSGKATCREYLKLFQFNPDPNATKGHVLHVSSVSGSSYMTFEVIEFTTHANGSIDREIPRQGDVTEDKMWFAPTTGIKFKFTRDGGSTYNYYFSFSATVAETAQGHHCPYPFIDLVPYVPIVLEETVIITEYEIRIDYIKDTDASHSTYIKVVENGEVIESFNSFPVEETMIGSRRVIFDVYSVSDHSHLLEIQISAVKLNCTCGTREHVFNASLDSAFFQSPEYPKRHCKFAACQTTFILPVELRMKYKMQVAPIALDYGMIEIEDGPNGIITWNKRASRSFAFESPIVTLKYDPRETNVGDIYSIEVELVERQGGCECPHQPNISSNLYFEIPAHCKNIDCLYLLPEFDDNEVQYHIESEYYTEYIGSRPRMRDHETHIFETRGPGKWTFDESGRWLVHFRRDKPTKRPTVFNLTYSSSGVHISHAERCGCYNKTILLQTNEPMEFTSPDWPAHYCDNLVCVTAYVAPAHHHLEVKLDTISLEPDNDRVAFFEGTNITTKHIEVVTGELIIPDPISSSGTVLTAVFISNGAVAFDGYNGTITAVMDKSWSHYLEHHLSGWWWLLALFILLSIGCVTILVLRKRKGMRRSQSVSLMDL